MKAKWIVISLITAAILMLAVFNPLNAPVAVSEGEPSDQGNASPNRDNISYQNANPDAGLAAAAENDRLVLHFDNTTGGIAILDKASGEMFYTNPVDAGLDPKADNTIKQQLMSQVELVYNIRGKEGDIQMNSYSQAMLLNQVRWGKIENGLSVEMILGRSEQRLLLPTQIRKSSFETDILEKIEQERARKQMQAFYILYTSEEAAKDPELLLKYPALESTDLYGRNTSDKDRDKRILEGYVKETGYTLEMLDAEYAAIGYDGDDTAFPSFKMYIDYVLDGDSLNVSLNAGEIVYDEEKFNLVSLSLLNFFGAGITGEEGYIFLPDGSGTLINFNDGTKRILLTNGKLYGWDSAIPLPDRGSFKQEFRYPVFGIKRANSALLGIIDEGDAVADINGIMGSINHSYNTAYANFTIKSKDRFIQEFDFEATPWILYEKEPYRGNIKLKYYFLTGEDADYVGMAKAYRRYLKDSGILDEFTPGENIPFYLETMGSVDMVVRKLGIPMRSQVPITTFAQAEDMMSRLKEKGIENIKLRYKGWYNGGIYYTAANRMRVEGVLGGRKGLKELAAAAASMGGEVYPDIDFMYVMTQRMFDGFAPRKDSIRTLFQKTGYFPELNPAFLEYENSIWCVNPNRIPTYYERFMAEYDKLDIGAVSLASAGLSLYSNFKNNEQVGRDETRGIVAKILEDAAARYKNVISDYGNAYIYPYADHILNLPEEDSSFVISDRQVPFIQIALHGSVSYAGKALNLANELRPAVLRAVEYGSSPYFVLNYSENGILKAAEVTDVEGSMYFGDWDEEAAAIYARMNEALSDVQDIAIADHAELAENVYMTTYENGKSIIVNYNNEKAVAEGITVEPLDFAIID